MQIKQDGAGKGSMPGKILLLMIKLLFSYSAAYFTSPLMIQVAYEERGYEAYGGEYILILLVFVAAYYTVGLILNIFGGKKRGKERSGRTAENEHTR